MQTIAHFSLERREAHRPMTTDRPPPCHMCNRLRLTADGFLKPCLFSDREIKVDLNDIRGSLLSAIDSKPLNGYSCSNRHMSVEEVLCEVQKHTQAINVATVYRTLEMLWEEGYVCRNDLSEGKIVYSVKSHGPHIHLVCRQCNRIIDADPSILEPLSEVLLTRHKFIADLQHISIFGICKDCQSQND